VLLRTVVLGISMGGAAGGLYAPKLLPEAHGYSLSNVTTLVFCGGAIGIIGNSFRAGSAIASNAGAWCIASCSSRRCC